MCRPSRNEILKLYKNLLTYGRELKYTDREYYAIRIRKEFKDNKEAKEEDKQFLYEVMFKLFPIIVERIDRILICQKRAQSVETEKGCLMCIITPYKIMFKYFYKILQIGASGQIIHTFMKTINYFHIPLRQKWVIDKSKVPQLDENDLKEKYIKGSGPGGSRVNKSTNCVCLTHEPTGITIKCHESRSLEINRKIARDRLVIKLDNLFNGEDSIENQKKRIEQLKTREKERRRKKRFELKEIYKEKTSIEDKTEIV